MGQADGSLPHLPCCGLLADKGIEVDIVLIPARGLAARFRDTHPRDHHVFADRLDPQLLSLAQRATLLVSRAMPGDFRDWAEIRQWADSIAADLTATCHQ